MDFREVTVEALALGTATGEWSARELAQAALDRIDHLDGELNAFVCLDPERTLADADRVDAAVTAGEQLPLAGVPLAVKDVADVEGWVSTCGSPAHVDDPPASSSSVLVERLRAAGAVVVGKTNTPEHGWTSDTTNPVFGSTANPWDLTRSPGGSSGGSAAAIAAGLVPLATGSDGGGSIRIPSAVCGLSGFKPTLGRVPNGSSVAPDWGVLSTSGPMARRTTDIARALDVAVGPHPLDPQSLPAPPADWHPTLLPPFRPLKAGWSPDFGYAPVDDRVAEVCRQAVDALIDAGVEVVEVDPPFHCDPVDQWSVLTYTYVRRALLPHHGTAAWEQMTPGLRELVEWAEQLDAVELVLSLDALHEAHVALARSMDGVDVLLSPTCAGLAPERGMGERGGTVNGAPERNWVRFTYPYNMSRGPAGTVNAGFVDGLPVGLQIGGRPGDDLAVLRTMAMAEAVLAIGDMASYG